MNTLSEKQYRGLIKLFGSKRAADEWLEKNSASRTRATDKKPLVLRLHLVQKPLTSDEIVKRVLAKIHW